MRGFGARFGSPRRYDDLEPLDAYRNFLGEPFVDRDIEANRLLLAEAHAQIDRCVRAELLRARRNSLGEVTG